MEWVLFVESFDDIEWFRKERNKILAVGSQIYKRRLKRFYTVVIQLEPENSEIIVVFCFLFIMKCRNWAMSKIVSRAKNFRIVVIKINIAPIFINLQTKLSRKLSKIKPIRVFIAETYKPIRSREILKFRA